MGRTMLIVVAGFIVSFGTIQNNLRQQASNAVETYVADYERTVVRNAANCVITIARRQLIQENTWRPAFLDEEEYVVPTQMPQAVFAPVFNVMDGGGAYALSYTDRTIDTTLARSLVRLTSKARYGDYDHEVRVVLRRRWVMPPVPAAVFIDAPATFNFGGVAFGIDGHDTRIGGGAGTADTLPGIGVIDAQSRAKAFAALKANQPNLIDGTGGTPSVEVLDVELDLAEIVRWLERLADRRLPDGTLWGGNAEWGTTDNPEIVVAEGDVSLSGGVHGAGVLLIKGNVSMTGKFEWHGPVIVVGDDVTISNAYGSPTIYGGLMIEANSVHFDVRGRIGMHYSSEALQGNEGKLNLNDFNFVSYWE